MRRSYAGLLTMPGQHGYESFREKYLQSKQAVDCDKRAPEFPHQAEVDSNALENVSSSGLSSFSQALTAPVRLAVDTLD